MRRKVILVEDQDTDGTLFTRAFKKVGVEAGHELVWYRSGVDATEYIESVDFLRSPPDLMVVDINLQGVVGFDLLSRIRQRPTQGYVPVVMLSSSTQPADLRRCYALGGNSYLSKPQGYRELKVIVERLIGYWLHTNRVPVIGQHVLRDLEA